MGYHVRIRSGALGGVFDGIVLGISLSYVTLRLVDGPIKISHFALLVAAVGPYRGELGTAAVPPVAPSVPATPAAPAPATTAPATTAPAPAPAPAAPTAGVTGPR